MGFRLLLFWVYAHVFEIAPWWNLTVQIWIIFRTNRRLFSRRLIIIFLSRYILFMWLFSLTRYFWFIRLFSQLLLLFLLFSNLWLLLRFLWSFFGRYCNISQLLDTIFYISRLLFNYISRFRYLFLFLVLLFTFCHYSKWWSWRSRCYRHKFRCFYTHHFFLQILICSFSERIIISPWT